MLENDEMNHKDRIRDRRRRSSFIQRCLSTSYSSGSPTFTGSGPTSAISEHNISNTQDQRVKDYKNKLKREKENWKLLLERFRKEGRLLKEKSPEVAYSWDFLTPEDKKFLEDRPDYVSIGRLLDSVTEAVAIKQQHINNTASKVFSLIKDCDQINNELTAQIIETTLHEFNEFDLNDPNQQL